jgi:hypothetical protein
MSTVTRRTSVVVAVALASVLICIAAVAPPTLALEWLCAGAVGACKVDSANLEVLRMEDSGSDASIECAVASFSGTGTVGPGANDETITTEFVKPETNCKPTAKAFNLEDKEVANSCTKVDNISAINLTWKTELVGDSEGKWDLLLKGSGAGQPGWLIECVTPLGLVDDTCVANAASTPLVWVENLAAEVGGKKLVTMLFLRDLLAAAEYASCSVGGKEEGLVVGEMLIEGLNTAGEPIDLEVS